MEKVTIVFYKRTNEEGRTPINCDIEGARHVHDNSIESY